jgi:hypothetical protein
LLLVADPQIGDDAARREEIGDVHRGLNLTLP